MSRQGRRTSWQPIVMVLTALPVMMPFMAAAQAGAVTSWNEALTRLDAVEPAEYQYLSPTMDPDVWHWTQGPADKASDAGSFVLYHSTSLEAPAISKLQWQLPDAGVRSYERRLVVGTLFTADGSKAVGGVQIHIALTAEDGSNGTHSVLLPLIESAELDDLEQLVQRLTELFGPAEEIAWTQSKEPLLTSQAKSTCQHYCNQDLAIRNAICTSAENGCRALAVAGAGACIITLCRPLIANPIAYGACLVSCSVAEYGALRLCESQRLDCQLEATIKHRECLDDCPPEAPIY